MRKLIAVAGLVAGLTLLGAGSASATSFDDDMTHDGCRCVHLAGDPDMTHDGYPDMTHD